MTVTEFLVVNVRVESAFGMWHDEVFEVKYPALDRLTDSGMTDIERDAGLSFSKSCGLLDQPEARFSRQRSTPRSCA